MGSEIQFLSDEIKISGTDFTFQIAQIKNKWAIRIIDRKANNILMVNKLKKTTDTVITDNIKNSLGRKYGKEIIQKIDFFDLGGKMPDLLRKIQEFKDKEAKEKSSEGGIDPTVKLVGSTKRIERIMDRKKDKKKSDSFWSTYSSVKTTAATAPENAAEISFDMSAIESTIKEPEKPPIINTPAPSPTPSTPAPAPPTVSPPTPSVTPDLAESLSVLGLTCPNCGAEVDFDDAVCKSCSFFLED